MTCVVGVTLMYLIPNMASRISRVNGKLIDRSSGRTRGNGFVSSTLP